MGVISDAIDSLEDWCSNLFKDGVKSQFDNISALLTDTFSQTTGSDGLVSTYLTSHLVHFMGGIVDDMLILTTTETQNFCDFLQKLKRIRFQAKK